MIAGGLVATFGLRACPHPSGCPGMCAATKERPCVLMTGPPPAPGTMPTLAHHSAEQLLVMAAYTRDADPGVQRIAAEELHRRGIET